MGASTESERGDGSYVVGCADCDVRETFTDPNEVVAFYRRHAAVTGHDVAVEQSPVDDVPVEGVDGDAGVEAVVRALDERDDYGDGVPLGVVVAAMATRGYSVGQTLDAVESVRLTGGLYEPRDDHLAAF